MRLILTSMAAASLLFACNSQTSEEPAETPETPAEEAVEEAAEEAAEEAVEEAVEEVAVDEEAVLRTYMAENNLDLPALLDGWVLNPQDVFDQGLDNFFILDIRQDDMYQPGVNDFEEGHIEGAHSVALSDVLTFEEENNRAGKRVLVVGYTGEDAAQAVMALRLSGVDAVSLKFGMSGWNAQFDLWTPVTGDNIANYEGAWVNTPPAEVTEHAAADITTGNTDAEAILAAQLNARVLDDLNRLPASDVLPNRGDYQIVNFWPAEPWDHYGHVDGAMRAVPGEFTLETIDMLDPAQPVIVYCWTGQTGSMVASWLQALGYEAATMTYGTNHLIFGTLESHKFPGARDLPVVTGA